MIMMARNRKLLSFIQELKQLVADDFSQDQFFQKLTQDLDRITSDLDADKLNVCLLSADLSLAQSFHQLLNSYQNLEDQYQFQLNELPEQPLQEQRTVYPASLVLQELEDEGTIKQTHYELSSKPVLEVGRKPECDIYIPDYCTRVSGQHLEVHFCPTEDLCSVPQWQIRNSEGCKNGTYINGKQLVGSQLLKAGDRLVLGDEQPASKSPVLLFECQFTSDEFFTKDCESQNLKKLVNCDILLLVIDSHRELLEEERKLLEVARSVAVFEVLLVIYLKETVEVINISKHPDSLIEVKKLNQNMASLDHKQIDLIKAKRALIQVTSSMDRANKFLLIEQEKLKHEMKVVENQQTHESRRESMEDVSSLLKLVNEQKISFSKSIETALSYSKHDLLDDSLADSIQQKIQDLIDALEAHVVKQDGKKYLELRAGSSETNVNGFIVEFCEEELLKWANEEWRKIRRCYGNGGLEGLVRSSNVILKLIYEKSNTNFNPRIKHKVEFEGVFQSSLKRIPCRIEYQEDPTFIYFIKKIRSSVFQVMGILFLLSFLGLSRGSFMKGIVSRITSSPLLSLLALGMIIWLMYKLYKTYQSDRVAEVRKASEKIRQELRNYYQKVVKNRFAEKLTQSLEAFLKEEISRFDEGIKASLHTTGRIPTETRNGRMDFKAHLKDCQSNVIKLEKKLKDFQKVKDKLQRLGES